MKSTCILLFLQAIIFPCAAQEVVSYNRSEWVRKQNREEIARVLRGETTQAIRNMRSFAQQHPGDAEVLYGLSLAYSTKGDRDSSRYYFEAALGAGMPMERFIAGPREGFGNLYKTKAYKTKLKAKPYDLLHGPMLGALTGSSARIWIRTRTESSASLQLFKDKDHQTQAGVADVDIKAEDDYAGVFDLDNLEPNKRYYYKLSIDGQDVGKSWSFETYPREGDNVSFDLAFGGGAAYNPEFERIWDTIAAHKVRLFLGMGDNVYIDHPELTGVQRFCYYQRQSSQPYQELASQTSILSIWDDHDFGENDSYGGPDPQEPAWKLDVLDVFKENFANPYYGSGDKPGIWYDHTIGDVQFFMLDCRYYRQPSTEPSPSMLGEAQREWLKEKLSQSTAAFKVIVSSVPWSDGAKDAMDGRLDTWRGYPEEREELFDFIKDNKINGVMLMSADRHRHDAWKHFREGTYPLYEFTSSRLTNIHYHELREGSLFGYNEKNGFGILSFNTEAKEPYVVFKVYNIDNELINQIRVYLHQMTH